MQFDCGGRGGEGNRMCHRSADGCPEGLHDAAGCPVSNKDSGVLQIRGLQVYSDASH